jgi:hypothetical protein
MEKYYECSPPQGPSRDTVGQLPVAYTGNISAAGAAAFITILRFIVYFHDLKKP